MSFRDTEIKKPHQIKRTYGRGSSTVSNVFGVDENKSLYGNKSSLRVGGKVVLSNRSDNICAAVVSPDTAIFTKRKVNEGASSFIPVNAGKNQRARVNDITDAPFSDPPFSPLETNSPQLSLQLLNTFQTARAPTATAR